MMSAAQDFRRVNLNRNHLHKAVGAVTLLLVVYMAIWTGVDPPRQTTDLTLAGEDASTGSTVVEMYHYCAPGESPVWAYVAAGWNLLLILCASILAVQTRNVVKTFNESLTLAILAYSHFLFVILRIFFFIFIDNFSGPVMNHLQSLVYSLDQMTGLVIYFFPKLWLKEKSPPPRTASVDAIRKSAALYQSRISNGVSGGSHHYASNFSNHPTL